MNIIREVFGSVERNNKYGIMILRLSLGIMYVAHGFVLKVMTFTIPGTVKVIESIGYPSYLAYVLIVAETLGGLMLIFKVQPRLVAIALVPVLSGAFMVHLRNGWVFNAEGGGWEYPAFLIATSIAFFLLNDEDTKADIEDEQELNRAL